MEFEAELALPQSDLFGKCNLDYKNELMSMVFDCVGDS
jgi:hypothetical protein